MGDFWASTIKDTYNWTFRAPCSASKLKDLAYFRTFAVVNCSDQKSREIHAFESLDEGAKFGVCAHVLDDAPTRPRSYWSDR